MHYMIMGCFFVYVNKDIGIYPCCFAPTVAILKGRQYCWRGLRYNSCTWELLLLQGFKPLFSCIQYVFEPYISHCFMVLPPHSYRWHKALGEAEGRTSANPFESYRSGIYGFFFEGTIPQDWGNKKCSPIFFNIMFECSAKRGNGWQAWIGCNTYMVSK